MGSNSLQTEGSYSEQYALFSGQYAHGNIENIIESVYEKENVGDVMFIERFRSLFCLRSHEPMSLFFSDRLD